MNKITFDNASGRVDAPKWTDSAGSDGCHHDTKSQRVLLRLAGTVPPATEPRCVPSCGVMDVSYSHQYSFQESFNDFSFASFLTNPDVNSARVKVRTECLKIMKQPLFNTHFTKTLRLDEFEQVQVQVSDQLSNYLKESWTVTLKNIIRNSFKDIGKGWFNIQKQNAETYEHSKLKRFIRMTRFLIEDSLRYMVEDSLQKFTAFVLRYCEAGVEVLASNSVRHLDKDRLPIPDVDIPPPLLALEVVLIDVHSPADTVSVHGGCNMTTDVDVDISSEGDTGVPAPEEVEKQFAYHIDPDKIEDSIVHVFDHALICMQGVPQLESAIMDKLFWARNSNLSSVDLHESKVVALRERLRVGIRKALAPVRTYLMTLKRFEAMLNLNVNHYVVDLQAQSPNMHKLNDEIVKHIQHKEDLARSFPSTVSLGAFLINSVRVREELLKKQDHLHELTVDMLTRIPKAICKGISTKFEEIYRTLKVKTKTPEEVDDLQKLIGTIPSAVQELERETSDALLHYSAIEQHRYSLTDKDFQARWNCQAWPQRIYRLLEVTCGALEDEKKVHEAQMKEEQASFTDTIDNLDSAVQSLSQYQDLGKVELVATEVMNLNKQLQSAHAEAQLYNSRERLFGTVETDYSRLKRVSAEFEPYEQLWITARNWKTWQREWMHTPLTALMPGEVEQHVDQSYKVMQKLEKEFKHRGIPACADQCATIRERVQEFRQHVPLIQALRNPGMRDRHWEQLSQVLQVKLHPETLFTLHAGLEMGLVRHRDVIAQVCDVASKEYAIEQALSKMKNEWDNVELEVKDYRETGTYVIRVDDTTMQQLDDHIVMTQAMSFSTHKAHFEDDIFKWDQQLAHVSDTLDAWLALQRQWMYLEPIFSSEDIQQQLPLEAKRFSAVNRFWQQTLGQAYAKPNILAACSSQSRLHSLLENNKILDSVQKGLADYLETKRLAFSRFFFLSNDELLQILSQTKDPRAVQPHLRKCFEAIAELVFEENLQITGMVSMESEHVPFASPMHAYGNVEDWLCTVETRMRQALSASMKNALAAYTEEGRIAWVGNWPAMIVLAVSSIFWTEGVESALKTKRVQYFRDSLRTQLDDLTKLVRQPLSRLMRKTIGALIVIDVHSRDVVQKLLREGVEESTAFEWISQLRYYYREPDEQVVVRMVQAERLYGFEYLGNSSRLVITPLTDRCYMTLMGAMHLNLGGAPAGPAGTGKTETVKDLAKAIAMQCVVFNCSDGLDYLAMGKFFKGLASAGAWACFDEFNRIDLEVLSVVAQQILSIQLAIQSNLTKFQFEESEIRLNRTCSVYITMNPGYAGRSELPDNLKALFRPCAMMVPDYALIGEISLFSFGFTRALELSRKMVATFKLCSEQLSSQDHYDYGMRAVKSVITAAGNLKAEYPDEPEDVLLLRGLRDVNVPKFLAHDLPLFHGIVRDLFPGVSMPAIEHGMLSRAIQSACDEMNIQLTESFETKVIQLYETTLVRHGLMLVGPTCSGKTAAYRALSRAMTKLKDEASFERVKTVVMNPKAITMGQLYGDFDEATHEWTDGVLACYMREYADDPTPDRKWIMFDGPVDAIWIENMNTVLDDNKKLCLVSGEIIQMTSTMTMMFEVEDLAVASPATVSRCGMVYMEPSALGYEPLKRSWLNKLPGNADTSDVKTILTLLFDSIVPPLTNYVRTTLKETVATVDMNLVLSFFNVMNSLLREYIPDKDKEQATPEGQSSMEKVIPKAFVFAVVWSIGATCEGECRDLFDSALRERVSALQSKDHTGYPTMNNIRSLKSLHDPCLLPPAGQSVYDYALDGGEWKEWTTLIPPFSITASTPFASIIVPTRDTIRHMYVLDKLINNNSHVLAVGGTGTGKTLTICEKLMKNIPEHFIPTFMTFSARTSANQTQDILDATMEKRRKGVYGPPSGKRQIIFVDDLNMPHREKYFAQPPIELLRQWMDHEGRGATTCAMAWQAT
eukprot:scaffold2645_cov378-Prasinococcus_capsulatus_cf.AAC.24